MPYVCSIPGCGKPHKARGWCETHYWRGLHHGDPLGGRATMRGEPARFLQEVVLPYDGDDCLLWPYSCKNGGYGQLGQQNVSVIVCKHANGPAPDGKKHACHNCGNPSCCNPKHLHWNDQKGNMADRIKRGASNWSERYGMAKLTEPEVKRIVALKGVMSQREIGKTFGINPATVHKIFHAQQWGG